MSLTIDDSLPCPFFGSGDVEIYEDSESGGDDTYVQCEECQARGPASRTGCRDDDDDEEQIYLESEAVELWNKRVAP